MLENIHRPKVIAFKVTNEEHDKLRNFIKDRNWNMSEFLRRAVEESMEKVIKEEK